MRRPGRTGAWRWVAAACALLALAVPGYGYWEATRPPRVVAYAVRSPAWTGPPLRIVQLSDTHAVWPDMPPARLAAIVARVNALRPDVVVLTGDYLSGRWLKTRPATVDEAVAPFAHLRARHGVFAVYGNHDYDDPAYPATEALAFARARVRLLVNDAARAGPFWAAGLDEWSAGRADIARALGPAPPGAPVILLTHNPDVFPQVPARVALTLAGHTHGGQIAPPLIGPLVSVSIYGDRYRRGHVVERGRHLVVSSGLGSSGVPIRIGVPPEIALVTLSAATP